MLFSKIRGNFKLKKILPEFSCQFQAWVSNKYNEATIFQIGKIIFNL